MAGLAFPWEVSCVLCHEWSSSSLRLSLSTNVCSKVRISALSGEAVWSVNWAFLPPVALAFSRAPAFTSNWFKYKCKLKRLHEISKSYFSWATLNTSSPGQFNVWINYGTESFLLSSSTAEYILMSPVCSEWGISTECTLTWIIWGGGDKKFPFFVGTILRWWEPGLRGGRWNMYKA